MTTKTTTRETQELIREALYVIKRQGQPNPTAVITVWGQSFPTRTTWVAISTSTACRSTSSRSADASFCVSVLRSLRTPLAVRPSSPGR